MFRFKLVLLVLLFLGIYSCTKSKIEQGEIQYELSYPYMEVDGLLAVIMPNEMTIVFKGTKMKTTISKGSFFETNIISDESNNYLAMYSDMDNQKIYCELTPSEITEFKNSLPTYDIKKTEQNDSLAGVLSLKYQVNSSDSLKPLDAWFTEEFAVQNGAWFTPYSNVVGFPLVYDIERYGVFTHAETTTFTEKELSDSIFNISGAYKKVDFQTYEKESKALFDLLIDW